MSPRHLKIAISDHTCSHTTLLNLGKSRVWKLLETCDWNKLANFCDIGSHWLYLYFDGNSRDGDLVSGNWQTWMGEESQNIPEQSFSIDDDHRSLFLKLKLGIADSGFVFFWLCALNLVKCPTYLAFVQVKLSSYPLKFLSLWVST